MNVSFGFCFRNILDNEGLVQSSGAGNVKSPWRLAWNEIRHNYVTLFCFCYILFCVLVAIFAPLLAPHDPDAISLVDGRLIPPWFAQNGSVDYLFGTDSTGRDVFSRILFGARVSLFLGFIPVCFAFVLGVPFGLLSGYLGGRWDEFFMRVNDCLLAFPSILLALIVVAFLGQGIGNLMIAVGISYAPTFARVIRSAVISERNKDYVLGASALGSSHVRIIFKHLFPNVTSSLIVIFTLSFASALLEAAGLSFLGLGIKPPASEWGSMLADGKNYFYDGWWMILFPGFAILSVVMSLNILGDALRDALDPRAQKKS